MLFSMILTFIENYVHIFNIGNDGKTTLLMFLVKLVDEDVLDLEDVANGCTDGSKVTFKQVDETLGTHVLISLSLSLSISQKYFFFTIVL